MSYFNRIFLLGIQVHIFNIKCASLLVRALTVYLFTSDWWKILLLSITPPTTVIWSMLARAILQGVDSLLGTLETTKNSHLKSMNPSLETAEKDWYQTLLSLSINNLRGTFFNYCLEKKIYTDIHAQIITEFICELNQMCICEMYSSLNCVTSLLDIKIVFKWYFGFAWYSTYEMCYI